MSDLMELIDAYTDMNGESDESAVAYAAIEYAVRQQDATIAALVEALVDALALLTKYSDDESIEAMGNIRAALKAAKEGAR